MSIGEYFDAKRKEACLELLYDVLADVKRLKTEEVDTISFMANRMLQDSIRVVMRHIERLEKE